MTHSVRMLVTVACACAIGSATIALAGGSPADQPVAFTPPPPGSMPGGEFGAAVKLGENVFRHTALYAKGIIGNRLNCSNCHLAGGALAGSSPLWAAYAAYPAYRSKNKKVNTFGMRLQGCFRYSDNGKVPALDADLIVALEAYSYWLATGAPTGRPIAGRGYPGLADPPAPPDYARGAAAHQASCELCHGADGQGQSARGQTVFPPLSGDASFNWGAGMGNVKNLAEFTHANMPFGAPGILTVQQACDVALFVDSQDRPQDPRFVGSVAETRQKFHDSKFSMYGMTVNGHVLGAPPK